MVNTIIVAAFCPEALSTSWCKKIKTACSLARWREKTVHRRKELCREKVPHNYTGVPYVFF